MEHNPESFGSVIMLFVDCKVNSVSGVKAFVDRYVRATLTIRAMFVSGVLFTVELLTTQVHQILPPSFPCAAARKQR